MNTKTKNIILLLSFGMLSVLGLIALYPDQLKEREYTQYRISGLAQQMLADPIFLNQKEFSVVLVSMRCFKTSRSISLDQFLKSLRVSNIPKVYTKDLLDRPLLVRVEKVEGSLSDGFFYIEFEVYSEPFKTLAFNLRTGLSLSRHTGQSFVLGVFLNNDGSEQKIPVSFKSVD